MVRPRLSARAEEAEELSDIGQTFADYSEEFGSYCGKIPSDTQSRELS